MAEKQRNRGGRPRKPDAKRRNLTVRLSDDDLAVLDAARGSLDRSVFVRWAAVKAAHEHLVEHTVGVDAVMAADPAVLARLLEPDPGMRVDRTH